MPASLSITASYAFVPIETSRLEELRREITAFGAEREMKGLVLLASEGINSTVLGNTQAIAEWKELMAKTFGPMEFKDSEADRQVFRRWSVKIKPEIVGLKDPRVRPQGKHRHLSPEEWHAMLAEEDVVIVDARNSFEYAVGKFRNAIDPGTRAFHEFPAAVAKAAIPKDKKVLMYCTGGIRCEKALIAMEAQGYENIYQLDGGILGYLEKFPEGKFEGECFVFDHRVAVDGTLRPSKVFGLCPHCGDPGDMAIRCGCGKEQKICSICAKDEAKRTCSKRCAHERRKNVPRVS